MKISYTEATDLVLNNRPQTVVRSSFRLHDGFIFLPVPSDLGEDDYILGGYVKVTDAGEVVEYSPVEDPEEFKLALKSRIE